MIKNVKITPYDGTDQIKLMSHLDDITNALKASKTHFVTEIWPNKGCDPEVAWTLLKLDEGITLFFAKGLLWKMYFERPYIGSLNNGIRIGMPMDEALKIDPTLRFDEWDEDYASSLGYWIEDNAKAKTVESVTIFIKEATNDESFFSYKWCEKQK